MAEAGGIAAERLRQFIERVERLEEERGALGADIREVYSEAKAVGFKPKIMRRIVKLRQMDGDEVKEQESLLEVYKHALGME